jgi:hypothetical protein
MSTIKKKKKKKKKKITSPRCAVKCNSNVGEVGSVHDLEARFRGDLSDLFLNALEKSSL